MIELAIPGRDNYFLEHLVLDLNGTITLDGEIIAGVAERLREINEVLSIHLVTADTLGNANEIGQTLQIEVHTIKKNAEDIRKLELIQKLGIEKVVCIGNGLNDVSMLKNAALGICVMGGEGAAAEVIVTSDLVVSNITDALDLILNPHRIIATLRT